MDDIHFHQTQLAVLEQRSRDIQQEILNSYNSFTQDIPFVMRNLRPSRRRNHALNTSYRMSPLDRLNEPTSQSSSSTYQYQDDPIPENRPTTSSSMSRSTSNELPSLSSSSVFSSLRSPTLSREDAFTYLGTFDIPLSQTQTQSTNNPSTALPTSFARSLFNRSTASASSSLNNNSNYDAGSLLLYFMMENLANDREEQQHGITDVSRYITDMLYHEVEDPQNTCCPIKMDVFTDETEVSQINKCKHLFCRQEIRTWLETHHTCPLCRTEIDA
jgi:hypothetical protein